MLAGLACLALAGPGCASYNYTHYLVEPAPKVPPEFEEAEGTQVRPFGFGSTTTMNVSWNDGNVLTEVQIPLLASGERIVIEHSPSATGIESIPATRLVVPPPTAADKTLDQAYRERGLKVNPDAPEVSIIAARSRMQAALESGNYGLALEWCEAILARYPSHPETLRAKGSLLVMLGERDKAIQVYQQAEEIESDPAVRKKLDALLHEAPP
jgi:hypothetical protein